MATNVSPVAKSKTRSGCLTCKSRHLKCDRRKPACLRCVSSKRICEGYTIVPQSISSTTHLLDDRERRGFLYFQARTVRKIFGQRDVNNWVPILLQLGHAEPTVKHIIIALASLHESLEPANNITHFRKTQKDVSHAAQVLALQHYNESIRLLRANPLNMTSQPDLIMILCILFMCFEQFRSDDAACLVHLMAGLKLVDSWRSLTNSYTKLRSFSRPTLDLVNMKVTPALQRLRVQFALCMDQRHELGNVGNLPYLPPPVIPSSYDSLDAARTDYDRAMNYVFSCLHHHRVTKNEAAIQDIMTLLRKWNLALDASASSSQTSSLQAYTRKLLDLYYHVAVIIAGTYATEVETVFDDYTSRFQSIIHLADDLVQYWKTTPQEYGLLFSFDLGITPPMFLVASRCRDPRIRRKAVDLMLQSPFYHGVWRDRYSGLCAQRMMEIEELGLEGTGNCTYLPEHRRIRKVCADLEEENDRIVLQYVYAPFTQNSQICTTLIKLTA